MKTFKELALESGYSLTSEQLEFNKYSKLTEGTLNEVSAKGIDAEWIKKSMILGGVLKSKQIVDKVFITGNKDGNISGYSIVKTTSKAKGDQFHRVEFAGVNNKNIHFNKPGTKGDYNHAVSNLKGVEINFDTF